MLDARLRTGLLLALLCVPGACKQTPADEPPESRDAGKDAAPGDAQQGDAGSANCSFDLCAPYRCDQGRDVCRMRCSEDAHCIAGFACEAGFCVGSECTAANARDVCGPYPCVRGLCAKTCSSAGCADGYYCRADTLVCVPNCVAREDPICAGYLCDLTVGECEPYCFAGELACAEDYRCNAQSECVR